MKLRGHDPRRMSEDELLFNVMDCAAKMGIGRPGPGRRIHHRPARITVAGEDSYRTAFTGDDGFPDCVFACKGRLIIAELKRETAIVGADQVAWGIALGTCYRLYRPSDWYSGRIIEDLRWVAGQR